MRYKRYLLDGGFSFGDEYIKPVWAIQDSKDAANPINFLEFQDEYKELCDELINYLNKQENKIKDLLLVIDGYKSQNKIQKKNIQGLKTELEIFKKDLQYEIGLRNEEYSRIKSLEKELKECRNRFNDLRK